MKRFNVKNVLALAAVVGMLSPATGLAQFNQGNQVTMGGSPVFNIAASYGGFSPEHRAWVTQDKLDNALYLSGDKSPSAVKVERRNGAIVVTLGGRAIATADAESARLEGLTARQLADKWADGIRAFLSDPSRTAQYVAVLKDPNRVHGGNVAIVERKLYVPGGTTLPVALLSEINSDTVVIGQKVEGKLIEDVRVGSFTIPMDSVVIGEVTALREGEMSLAFTNLQTPSGTLVPIAATVADTYVFKTEGPHRVATIGMPAGIKTECRVPAHIGVGTIGGRSSQALVLRKGSNRVLAANSRLSVVIDNPQPVAVVIRDHAM